VKQSYTYFGNVQKQKYFGIIWKPPLTTDVRIQSILDSQKVLYSLAIVK